MKTNTFFMKIILNSVLLFCIMLLSCCENNESKNGIQKETMSPPFRQHLYDSCMNQLNNKLMLLCSNPTDLKNYLTLDDSEVDFILKKSNIKYSKSQKELLIKKIANFIADTTVLPIQCDADEKLKVYKGSLALVSLYLIEPFPFFAALGSQWCTGGPMSDSIFLPYNFTEYGRGEFRNSMQKQYISYLKGSIRREWQKEHFHR